jgi:hypothetical protein
MLFISIQPKSVCLIHTMAMHEVAFILILKKLFQRYHVVILTYFLRAT